MTLRTGLARLLIWTWGAVTGIAIGYALVGPLPEPSRAQRAMLDGFMKAYCHPDRANIQKAAIEAAIWSRLTISVGLADRALAEYNVARVEGACT